MTVPGSKDNMIPLKASVCHDRPTTAKVRDELSRLLSPEFNVTIDDVGDIINILNVIKARCASLPEKFRLLVGLLCRVDLSITNIEEHYEQVLVKNRIFHLLRMFPDIAHPLLDAIARATNRDCPLSSLPVTIGRIPEERQLAKTKGYKRCNNTSVTVTSGMLHSYSRLGTQAQNSLLAMASRAQRTGTFTPKRVTGMTPPIPYAASGMTPPVSHAPSGMTPPIPHAPSGMTPPIPHAPSGMTPPISHASSGMTPPIPHAPSGMTPPISHASSGMTPPIPHAPSGMTPPISHASSGMTLPIPHAASAQILNVTSNASLPLASGSHMAQFDSSHEMSSQVPLSLHQSSLQSHMGVVSSGAKESPTDIQKRILLQQQHQLRQQLEMLQAQRLQQLSYVRSLTFEQMKKAGKTSTSTAVSETVTSAVSHTPASIMEPSRSGSSAVIGQSNISAQPIRITRSCSGINKWKVQELDSNSGSSSSDMQALDLRSPERQKDSDCKNLENDNISCNRYVKVAASKKLPAKRKNIDSDECIPDPQTTKEPVGESAEKVLDEKDLTLSQVGRHCILVSVRDNGTAESSDCAVPETGTTSGKNESEMNRTKSTTEQKQRKGKAGPGRGRSRGAIINVQKLCNIQNTRPSNKKSQASKDKTPSHTSHKVSMCSEPKTDTSDRGCTMETVLVASQRDAALTEQEESHVSESHSDSASNNNNNSNSSGVSHDPIASHSNKRNASKRQRTRQSSKSGNRKRRKGSQGESKTGGVSAAQRPAVDKLACQSTVSTECEPLDLSQTLTSPLTTRNTVKSLNATNAEFEPLTGLWRHQPSKAKKDQPCQTVTPSQDPEAQSLKDTDSTYLLCSGCDDDAWYQSTQSVESEVSSNQSELLSDGSQSNVSANSALTVDSFLTRLTQDTVQTSPAVNASGTQTAAAVTAVSEVTAATAAAVKRKLPKPRSCKDKSTKRKH